MYFTAAGMQFPGMAPMPVLAASSTNGTSSLAIMRMLQEQAVSQEHVTVGHFLDKGAFGDVETAYYHGTVVAVKYVRALGDVQQQNITLQNLKLELEIVKFLRHPNIVGWIGIVGTFPELGKTEPALTVGSMFEYCEGGQLNNLIHIQKVQFSSAQKLSMMTDIAMGLSYLHAQNIIHRDLSTRNLLLQDGNVKLCDFGCARRLTFGSNSITPKMIMGSPPWMSPEQISGQPLTLKSDVFSYGTIVWEIATGLVPHDKADENFTAPSTMEVFKAAICNGLNPRLPSAGHMPDCSPSVLSDLNRLLMLLSQHSPDLRPTSEQARRIITQIAKGVCSDMNDTPIEGNVSRLFMWLEDRMDLGRKIVEFYKKYNPTKMSTLSEVLANFVGTEVEMSDHARLGPQ